MTDISVTDLLIAPPNMPDSRFRESVLIIISHDESGTIALCLNQHTDYTTSDLSDLDEQLGISKLTVPIFWGGPVASETVWVLHDDQWQSENTMQVGTGISVSSDRQTIEKIISGETPRTFRIFSGFAAWGPGQLESELSGKKPWSRSHAWLVAPCTDLEDLLECPIEDLWTWATTISANTAVDRWL